MKQQKQVQLLFEEEITGQVSNMMKIYLPESVFDSVRRSKNTLHEVVNGWIQMHTRIYYDMEL